MQDCMVQAYVFTNICRVIVLNSKLNMHAIKQIFIQYAIWTQISEHLHASYLCCLGHYGYTSSLWEVWMSKALLEQSLQPATKSKYF